MKNSKQILGVIYFLICTSLFAQKDVKINVGSKQDLGYTAGKGILPNKGVNDPHVHIFNDKAYLFASHDTIIGKKNSTYMMPNWNIYSSQDLVHWEKEFVLQPEDTYVGKKIDKCFATDGATRNGKYYYYFSNFSKSTGVAVGDKPGGPYIDSGRPIISKETDPSNNRKHDPTIFVDDDGKYYIMWGQTGWNGNYYQLAELNEDMISLKTKGRDMVVTDNTKMKHDGGYLHKHNETYYLSAHKGKYATSKSLYGPYEFRGAVEAHGDHGTYFTWHNQTYYIAGGWAKPYFRYTYLTYAHYKDNGEIVAQRVLNGEEELGVARYNCSMGDIQAECFFAASDELVKKEISTGFEMRNIQNGSYLFFPKLFNMLPNPKVSFKVASAYKDGGTIEIRKGNTTGELLGSCTITSTGSWNKYKTFSCTINNTKEIDDLYLVFKGDSDKELMRLDAFNIVAKPMQYNPIISIDSQRHHINQTFTSKDELVIEAKYHAGTGNTVAGQGVEFLLREMDKKWKPVKTYKEIGANTKGSESGVAKVTFDLEKLTPTDKLEEGHFYHLLVVMKTSEGKNLRQAFKTKMKIVKKKKK